jgi:hypothetical protein
VYERIIILGLRALIIPARRLSLLDLKGEAWRFAPGFSFTGLVICSANFFGEAIPRLPEFTLAPRRSRGAGLINTPYKV